MIFQQQQQQKTSRGLSGPCNPIYFGLGRLREILEINEEKTDGILLIFEYWDVTEIFPLACRTIFLQRQHFSLKKK